jgi:hypothetical protein
VIAQQNSGKAHSISVTSEPTSSVKFSTQHH